MTREELKALGLEKEAIDKIMDIHKVDVEQHKADLDAKKAELATKDTKITELTETITKFDGVDVDKLQKDVKDWESKYNEDLTATKKDSAIKLAITKSKARNEKALMALLDTDIIKVNADGSVIGLNEQLENIKKDNDFLFEVEKKNPEDVNLGGDHDNNPAVKETTWEGALEEHYGKE